MGKRSLFKMLRIASSGWMIVGLLAFGLGPIFVIDAIWTASPNRDALYEFQVFALQWMFVTILCVSLAMLLALVNASRLAFRYFLRRDKTVPGSDA